MLFWFNVTFQIHAQSVWTNTAANAAWGNAANWSPHGIPNAIDAVVTTTNLAIITTNTPENIAASGFFPFTFGTLNAGTGSIGGNNANNRLNAAVSSGTPVINTFTPGAYTFFYSTLSGTQGFNKIGSGLLTFRYNIQAQSYTGNITISAGTLELESNGNLGNAANTVTIADGANLSSRASGNNQTVTLPVTRSLFLNAAGGAAQLSTGGAGYTNLVQGAIGESAAGSGLTITGAGTVVLSGVNTYTGPTTINGGCLSIDGAGRLNSGFYGAAITNKSIFDYSSSANQLLTGIISGNGALIQGGSGTLTLSSANTYSGNTTVSSGTLALGGSGSLSANSSIIIKPGATFDVSGLGAVATYALGSSASLTATGGSMEPVIKGGLNGIVSFGNRPITLNFDGANPALTISQGALNLDGQTITVNAPVPLANGSYNIIRVTSGKIVHGGSFLVAGTATYGTGGGTIGFATNAGVAYVNMTISGSTNAPISAQSVPALSSSNNVVTLIWPADYLGWLLWVQTNSLTTGLNPKWHPCFNSVAGTNLSFTINPANGAVFFRMTYGDYGGYYLTNMLTNWDGHYELANTNVPPSSSSVDINNNYYTWKIVRGANSYSFIVDNEKSGQVTATNDPKSRSELYVPLHIYTNGQQNLAAYHIQFEIPPLTDYGSNNSPFWAMQVYHASGKPMLFLGLTAPYQGLTGQPQLGVYTNMTTDGTTTGATQYFFKLIKTPFSNLGDVRSTNGYSLTVNLDFATNATPSVTAQIAQLSAPDNIYQATCFLPLQSTVSPFTNGTKMYLKFGSYNAGGLHHHAKVTVSWFNLWSSAPFPSQPVLGTGKYYIPALQREISAGNYDYLHIQ